LLEKETEAAREKQQAMKEEWKRWLWSDPDRANKVARIFNDKLNRTVGRKYDGEHLSLPGMTPTQSLNPHQKDAVWRSLQSRQVLYDHVVGAGKTAVIVATMMEMRRMGIARKPIIAVPNHLTLQWRGEFSKFYPAARVLAATPDDFTKGNREKFFSKIVTGDWDAVVVGHSSLKKIGLPPTIEQKVLQEQISELADAIEMMKRERGDRHVVRDMEKIKARIEAQVKTKMQKIGERDKVLTFDELGLDAFAVDELHEFKNLFYNSTMDRVPGMGNPSGSDKAFDLFVKTQWMWETFGDKAVLLGATGTPISNSMVEMFNLQRYMQYPTLQKQDLQIGRAHV
jgi:N12 class adenine-specific DNA methylase